MHIKYLIPKSFTFKIALCFVILFAVPSLLLLNRLYFISKEISLKETRDYLNSSVKSAADNFDEILRNVDFLHTQVLSDNDFIENNANLKPRSETYSYSEYQLKNTIMSKLTKYYISNTYIYSLALYNTNADTLYLYSMDYTKNNVIEHPSSELLEGLKMSPENNSGRTWSIQKEIDGEEYVFNSTSVPNIFRNAEPPLYFMISVDTNILANRVAHSTNSSMGLCVMDSFGILIPVKDSQEHFTSSELSQAILGKDVSDQETYTLIEINDIPHIAVIYRTDYTDFTYIAYIPMDSANQTPSLILKYQNIFLVTLGLLFVVVLLITFQYVIKPIKKLHKSFSSVGDGDLSVRMETKSEDEIGQIYSNFNQMMDKLNQLIKENYETRLVKKETELKYIHSQINEHFLYNTLDSIHWIAKREHVPEISKIIFSLSKFFRMVLNEGSDTITISQVLEIFTAYIDLLNIRTDPKIMFSCELGDGMENFRVLKYVFHPLLENALLHGISGNKGDKKVMVIFQRIPGSLIRFTITDNGIGIPPEKLTAILSSIHSGSLPDTGEKYFALQNVNQQLNLFYGNDCNLSIESTISVGTTVYFDIPIDDIKQ